MHQFKELKVWQKAIEITKEIYVITCKLPQEEKYGLQAQMRRSAVSIASNIAEGAASNSNKEFGRFLGMANGSLHELETQVFICNELVILSLRDTEPVRIKITELQKMLFGLRKTIEEKSKYKPNI